MNVPTKERAIAALYQWLTFGVGLVGLLMGIASFCMNATTLATVKGIYVPMWQVPIVFLIILLGCVFIGWVWDHFQFWSAVNSRSNKVQNPEFDKLCKDIEKIKNKLEIE